MHVGQLWDICGSLFLYVRTILLILGGPLGRGIYYGKYWLAATLGGLCTKAIWDGFVHDTTLGYECVSLTL